MLHTVISSGNIAPCPRHCLCLSRSDVTTELTASHDSFLGSLVYELIQSRSTCSSQWEERTTCGSLALSGSVYGQMGLGTSATTERQVAFYRFPCIATVFLP